MNSSAHGIDGQVVGKEQVVPYMRRCPPPGVLGQHTSITAWERLVTVDGSQDEVCLRERVDIDTAGDDSAPENSRPRASSTYPPDDAVSSQSMRLRAQCVEEKDPR